MTTTTYRQIFAIVLPTLLANITVPMVGLVDLAVIGWYGRADWLAALTTGGTVFSILYWAFGFLRQGITGPLGQLFAQQETRLASILIRRYASMALIGGILIFVIARVFSMNILWFFDNGDGQFLEALHTYMLTRLYSAPVTLVNYVVLGVLLAFGNGRWLMIQMLSLNLANIFFSWLLGWQLNGGIQGVAIGSILAELIAVAIGISFIHQRIPIHIIFQTRSTDINRAISWHETVQLSSNIFIRNLLLTMAFAWFTQRSAMQATLLVAINGVLLKYLEVISYGLDGFADALESLAARAFGQQDWRSVRQIGQKVAIAAGIVAIGLAIVFYSLADEMSVFITQSPTVLQGIRTYQIWLAVLCFTGVFAYLLDGLYLAAAAGREIRRGMIFAFLGYALSMFTLPYWAGNHGLWCALAVFLALRGLSLWIQLPKLRVRIAP